MKSFLYMVISLLVLLLSVSAVASYRVYKLKVETFSVKGRLERVNVVMSTLDYLQYEHYYGGYGRMKVSLVDTWYCPGDTSRWREYCPKPYWTDRFPASLDHPKRTAVPYNLQPVIP
jgi:hypothetical protein